MLTDADEQTSCLLLEARGWVDWFVFGLLLAIPVVAAVLITRIARRNPSRFRRQLGRRRLGDRVSRVGVVLAALGILATIVGIIVDLINPGVCDAAGGLMVVFGTLAALTGGVLAGVGSAVAVRAGWVGLATMTSADLWIFYFMVIVALDEPDAVQGLLLLAFAIHSVCSLITARWSFRARDLGPIERAKAGEAGRTVGAVWVFLVCYTALSVLRDESGIFDSAAGSAVTAALTLGALAATMGSGFTKYTEAMNAPPPPEAAQPWSDASIPVPAARRPAGIMRRIRRGETPADDGTNEG